MKENVTKTPRNPIATFNKAWQIAERVGTAFALIMVAGTIGLVSLHVWA
ncbi:hypothetical protein [Alicyclobacillus ferrooxydans]|nr:hypothetical protein [Alicyclobacillus ferrooxydans]